MSTLELRSVSVRYGAISAVRNITLRCEAGTVLSLIGPNGAGKSSTLLAAAGAAEGTVSGSIWLDGQDITKFSAEKRVRSGIALVPEGRRIFTRMTVEENLILAKAGVRGRGTTGVEAVYARFPILREFAKRHAGLLSGGQQQQLAIGRALMTEPRFLLLDEPSLGLSPKIVEEVFQAIIQLRTEGLGIVLVEQNAVKAAELADRTLVLRNGAVEGEGSAALNEELVEAFFGARRKPEKK